VCILENALSHVTYARNVLVSLAILRFIFVSILENVRFHVIHVRSHLVNDVI